MEIIELTAENIEQYIQDCIEAQSYLLKPNTEIKKEHFIKTAEDDHSYFLGVLEGEKLIGMGVLSKVVHPVRTNGYINNIVVHPEGRGQGLFTVLMDNLEEKAKEWECTRIELTCSRQEVQGMYERKEYTKKDTNVYFKNI